MTIKELISNLQALVIEYDDEAGIEVVLAGDAEGNRLLTLDEITREDTGKGKLFVIWPTDTTVELECCYE